jgi:hypothetical protein
MQQRTERADHALGHCQAGECLAWRRKLTGRFFCLFFSVSVCRIPLGGWAMAQQHDSLISFPRLVAIAAGRYRV